MLQTLLDHAALRQLKNLALNAPPGCFVEVGVYKGGSAWHLSEIAKKQQRNIYLYDTFEGIPYRDVMDYHKEGDFNDTSYEIVKNSIPYANVIKGIFPDSAINMESIAFVHIDCDQYKSIKDSVNYLLPKMVPNGIIIFDDYNWLDGATLAVNELFPIESLIPLEAPHSNGRDRVYTIIKNS